MTNRPVLYAIVSIIVSLAVVFFVFPGFVSTYSESGTGVPGITQAAIEATDGQRIYGWFFVFAVAALVVACSAFLQNESARPATRVVFAVGVSAIAALMLIVTGFFLAAIAMPMFAMNS